MSTRLNPDEPTTIEKLRGLRWNALGDAANTVFVQFTFFGSVFILFLSELGLSKSQIGFMLSLFPFAGLVAPFIAPAVARFGYKRTFVTFWGLRKGMTAFLLLIPWVMRQFGETTTIIFVGLIIAGFALCRAIAETGKYPWTQEYVPNQVRGKFSAVSNLFTTITGLIAVAVAGYVLERTTELSGYIALIGVGLIFGLLGFWAYSFIPGGAPIKASEKKQPRAIREAIADPDFRNYLIGIALMTIAGTPMLSFLPLFMQEQVGLNNGEVVLLQNGALIGGLVSVYIWGWAADRFGGTPVTLTGILSRLLLPVFWLVMPRFNAWSLPAALAISFFQGLTAMSWAIGTARLLFVNIVPPEKKSDYMALYYAWIGVVGGFSQLIGGWLLLLFQNLSGQFLFFPLDPYTPLFFIGLILPLISLLVLHRIHLDNEVGVGQFAGILFRGNPLTAVESMIRYHLAKDEHAAIISTEKLGRARSLLTFEELLESLQDPRFNVRFEAILAIGRNRPDERLVNALADILHSSDPALSVMAAWALGRIGSKAGHEPLRKALDSDYRSIRGHSARSLATLEDDSVAHLLHERLQEEPDRRLRIAYAAALGQLGQTAVTPTILSLLHDESDSITRSELALALARLVGDENGYIHMLRQVRKDMDTAVSQIIHAQSKKWPQAADLIDQCAAAFSLGQHAEGVERLVQLAEIALERPLPEPHRQILQESISHLSEFKIDRNEYLLLTLHILATHFNN